MFMCIDSDSNLINHDNDWREDKKIQTAISLSQIVIISKHSENHKYATVNLSTKVKRMMLFENFKT